MVFENRKQQMHVIVHDNIREQVISLPIEELERTDHGIALGRSKFRLAIGHRPGARSRNKLQRRFASGAGVFDRRFPASYVLTLVARNGIRASSRAGTPALQL